MTKIIDLRPRLGNPGYATGTLKWHDFIGYEYEYVFNNPSHQAEANFTWNWYKRYPSEIVFAQFEWTFTKLQSLSASSFSENFT